MTMSKCRECNGEVSTEAKTCPKCGVSKPVKEPSILRRGLIALFIIVVIVKVMDSSSNSGVPAAQATVAGSMPRTLSESDLAKNVVIKSFKWSKDGFGSIMVLKQIVVENKNAEAVKDFEIQCDHRGPSGTVIDHSNKVIYQILPAEKKSTFRDINMGFLQSQSESSDCQVLSVARIGK